MNNVSNLKGDYPTGSVIIPQDMTWSVVNFTLSSQSIVFILTLHFQTSTPLSNLFMLLHFPDHLHFQTVLKELEEVLLPLKLTIKVYQVTFPYVWAVKTCVQERKKKKKNYARPFQEFESWYIYQLYKHPIHKHV